MSEHPSEDSLLAVASQCVGEERAAFLDRVCAGDATLRQRLEDRLAAHDQAPTVKLNIASAPEISERVGRYKLLQKIGEGGCGVVYMADQDEPVRRRVALKVIKPGMDTKEVLARFEAERQALALMDHPNIAKVFDGGATENGRPFFVMELVKGITITEYCDNNKLSTRDRLAIFSQICHAIQHAHQKGIIHRDIKPSNILVVDHNDVPVPKVIDFGIAKATTNQQLTDKTLFTALEQFIGTPAYMSPEQAVMSGLDIDTRSDIYSLGVLLYELLTGKTPFDTKRLFEAGFDEIRRIIRDEEPPRPSTRLSTLDAIEQSTLAKLRDVEPPKLLGTIRGDLDWIVMKAMEKDRTRRYETAYGLAMDIQRHLNNEPIVARPPSSLYRFQKLISRNKLAFAATSAVAAALIIGLGLSTWLFFKEKEARQRAVAAEKVQNQLRLEAETARQNEARLRRKAEAEETKAKTEANKSQQVAQFLKDMLKAVDPSVSAGRDTTMLREILDKTAERLSQDLTNQPEVEAELRLTIGRVYLALRRATQAETMFRQALVLWRTTTGRDDKVADSLNQLAIALRDQGKSKEAETTLNEALTFEKKLFGNEHASIATSLHLLAGLSWNRGELDKAESLYRQVLDMRRKLLGDENDDVASSLNQLAMVLNNKGEPAEAEPLHRQALAIYRKLHGNDHPGTAWCLTALGEALANQNKLSEATSVSLEALAGHRKLRDPGWINRTMKTVLKLAKLYDRGADGTRNEVEAGKLYREVAEQCRQHADQGDIHAQLNLAGLYDRGQGVAKDTVEATRWYRKAAEQYRKKAENGDPLALNNVAWFLATGGNAESRDGRSAVTFAEQAVAATNRKEPAYLDTLAAAYAEAGQFEKAVGVQKEAIALLKNEKSTADFSSRLKLYESNSPYREVSK